MPRATPGWNPFWSAPVEDRLRLHLDRIVETVAAVKPEDVLLMNVCGGDGWEPLCRFLGVPRPENPFPHCDEFRQPAAAHDHVDG